MAATTLASRIVTRVLYRLGENTLSPVHWSRAEILDLVWEGLLEATLISGHLQTDVNLTLTGNSTQAAPDDVAVLHVRSGNTSMQKYSIDDLDAGRPGWDAETPTATPARWCALGVNQMLFEPRTGADTPTVVCTLLQYPTTLGEADTIPLEDEYCEALTYYAFAAARLKEGGAEWKQSVSDYDRFLQLIGELTQRVGWKSAPGWVQAPKTQLAIAVPRQRELSTQK